MLRVSGLTTPILNIIFRPGGSADLSLKERQGHSWQLDTRFEQHPIVHKLSLHKVGKQSPSRQYNANGNAHPTLVSVWTHENLSKLSCVIWPGLKLSWSCHEAWAQLSPGLAGSTVSSCQDSCQAAGVSLRSEESCLQCSVAADLEWLIALLVLLLSLKSTRGTNTWYHSLLINTNMTTSSPWCNQVPCHP